jgi:hypothetical protein
MRLALCLGVLLTTAVANADDAPPLPAAPPPVYVAPTTAPPPYYYPPYYYPPPKPARPRTIPYRGGAVAPGYHVEDKTSPTLVTGIAMGGGAYVLSFLYALSECPPKTEKSECRANSAYLYIPVVGPFITAADSQASFGGRNLAIMDGVVQSLAVVLIGVGASSPSKVLVRDTELGAGYSLHLSPGTAGATTGLTLTVKGM